MAGTWKGKVYKVAVPAVNAAGQYDASSTSTYPDNPLDSVNPWRLWPLFNATRPVRASSRIVNGLSILMMASTLPEGSSPAFDLGIRS